jgi:rhodanese-related sulfurtransferase
LKKPDSVQLSIPESPDAVPRETLKDILGKAVVIDVRTAEEFATGAITGSRNVPFESFTPDAAKELAVAYKDKPSTQFVFVSTQSPDLDQSAALLLMQACTEVGVSQEVLLLQGGLLSWIRAYGSEPALVQNFDVAKWNPVLVKSPTTAQKQGQF